MYNLLVWVDTIVYLFVLKLTLRTDFMKCKTIGLKQIFDGPAFAWYLDIDKGFQHYIDKIIECNV